jgi:hypothetical protein
LIVDVSTIAVVVAFHVFSLILGLVLILHAQAILALLVFCRLPIAKMK